MSKKYKKVKKDESVLIGAQTPSKRYIRASIVAKKFKRFKISSSLLIAAIIVGFAIFLYLFFSKPERPATVIWPEYDYTQQYNPFSDKNPNGSVTVGEPMYTAPINIENGNKSNTIPRNV